MEIRQLITALRSSESEISEQRKQQLTELAMLIQKENCSRLAFICTHNSRRSQLAEVWIDLVDTSLESASAGTEATAFNERMVAALQRSGAPLEKVVDGENPQYRLEGFDKVFYSKTVEELEGAGKPFIAVMVCSDADANCPYVPGAQARFSLQYTDPKAYDGTEHESLAYMDKVEEVGREMVYLTDRLKQLST